ncbi:MAG: hypothetical protein KME45_30580 [Stenomitos rutilans HA7619-LM2]|jgi:hypothetical protein|nr:hypothetical protein [Stenomitos rutilans HA7619-LM2]
MKLTLKALRRLLTATGWLSFQLLKQAVRVAHEQLAPLEPGTPTPIALPPAGKTVTVETTTVPLSPVERELVAVAEQAAAMVESQNRNQRSLVVTALLDEAWSQGLTTYPQLLEYVKAHTGEACSRRAIANWKRQRGLLVEPCQAA